MLVTRDVTYGEILVVSDPLVFMRDKLGVAPNLDTMIKALSSLADLSAGKKYVHSTAGKILKGGRIEIQ
jgi:hypothetical protein